MPRRIIVLAALLLIAGCGDDGGGGGSGGEGPGRTANLHEQALQATRSSAADFPATEGRTLEEIANEISAGPQVGLATTVHTTPRSRLAFGVLDDSNRFVYGPTAVYVAPRPDAKARGPFPAPADSLITDGKYRSQQAAGEQDPFAAVYETEVDFNRPGRWAVLVVTKIDGTLAGGTAEVRVTRPATDPIPAPGDPAPKVATDTAATVGSNRDLLDTRVPPSDMHEESFDEVVGRKPVALLFSTPQLCQSRVCGPVTDIAFQLEQTYRDRMTFIHQEVYRDNDLNKGLRPPLEAFKLRTEPWLFTIRADGKVAARLEGSFGFDAFERAVKAAL